MDAKILAMALLTVTLLGCAQTGTGNEGISFELGKEFTLTTENSWSHNLANDVNVLVTAFTDSRCPSGVQCIWEGELGVDLNVVVSGPLMNCASQANCIGGDNSRVTITLYLGETTKPKETFSDGAGKDYEIELVSIVGEKSVTLKVSEVQQPPAGEKAWFSYEPRQCGTNPWDEGQWQAGKEFRNEEERVSAWLGTEQGIETYGYASKNVYDVVCAACSCPRGDRIAVLVDSGDAQKMTTLGWKNLGSGIACTMEAKVCPDGSAVGRTAPFCEFEECPAIDLKDVAISIKKTDVPGFMLNPRQVIVTIGNDGNYTIEVQDYNSLTGELATSISSGNIGRHGLEELAQYVLSTNFLSLTEEDTRMCIADIPTKTLEVSIGGRHNEISNIGAECEPERTAAARNIISKIEEATGQAG